MINYTFKIEENNNIPYNIGGKARNLCILKNNKVNAPPAFVVNSDAFEEHISRLKIDEIKLLNVLSRLNNFDDITESLLKKIQDIIVNTPINEPLRNALVNEVNNFPSNVKFAIRSSVTVEDSKELSWAGQFESFLNISNSISEIESAIKSVWASTFSFRSVSYCIRNDIISIKEMKMAVIIQEMVNNPDFSGVSFTNHPISNSNKTIYIEFAKGYGDKLVSGKINPYKITINKHNDSYSIDEKDIISTNLIKSLKYNSMLIEKIYNKPQDIEWSISDDEIFFLQSRPITCNNIKKSELINTNAPILVQGLPASSGIGSGKAIIINNINDATKIKRGVIIVAPMTNPDMVPYMRNSIAIVTDVGGMICHTAIVAREMQIPCIVGTNNATKIIKESERITVDGNNGKVYKGNVNIDSTYKKIPDILESLSKTFERSLRKNNTLYYYGIDKPNSLKGYDEIVINPYFIDLESKFQEKRKIPLKEQNNLKNDFIDNIKFIVASTTCKIVICKSNIIKDLNNYSFIKENEDRIILDKEYSELSNDFNIDKKNLTKINKSKNFFGHIPSFVLEGYPYPPRTGPWWPENWNYDWSVKTTKEEITWANVRPEIVNTPFTKSLIVQGVEKIPYIFKFNNIGPLYTKWKRCRIHIDINKLDKVRNDLSNRFINNINSFINYIGQLHESYDEWGYQTDIIRKEIGQNGNDIKFLINRFKTLWKLHEDFFALCFLIQTIGDDIIWPKIQSFLSEVYKNLDINDNAIYSSEITKVLASPPEKTLSRLYLEDLTYLKSEKEKLVSGNTQEWKKKLKDFLEKWNWIRDRDLFYQPINNSEMVESIIGKMDFTEPPSKNYWHSGIEKNMQILSHLDLSKWFIELILIGNYLHIERENHHLIWVKNVDLIRDITLSIGKNFKANDLINSEDDIFFIQIPEILMAIENDDFSLIDKNIIENRKNAFMYESKTKAIKKNILFKEEDYY